MPATGSAPALSGLFRVSGVRGARDHDRHHSLPLRDIDLLFEPLQRVSALYSEARQPGGEGLIAMADASDLEERLRRLEESRDALAKQVAVLNSKEAKRDRLKELDKAFMPIVIVMAIIFVVLVVVMSVQGPPKHAEWWWSTGYPSSAGKAYRQSTTFRQENRHKIYTHLNSSLYMLSRSERTQHGEQRHQGGLPRLHSAGAGDLAGFPAAWCDLGA
jgi:hypothetical protein